MVETTRELLHENQHCCPSLLAATCLLLATTAIGQWLETRVWVDSFPSALCYNSRDNKLYCANYVTNTVTVVDGASNEILCALPSGQHPLALTYNSIDNKVYCANEGEASITVFDGASDSVVATVDV